MFAAPRLQAQERGAAALGELVAGLGTTARVMMIGAHPDDEDTQLISFLAKGRHLETAYLSLTRGDGGQNLIGNELGPVLGMIRTEELLAARRIDGGRQYFTRAYDFGYSRTLEETLEHWPKDSILKDMVAIVRAFRPHVIIAVWSGTPQDGHGNHQYAGVLSREVFRAASDTVRFPPSSVRGLRAWSPAKYYLARRGEGLPLNLNVGEYDPVRGQTYSEVATISRSQHRSQGQGELPERGPRFGTVRLDTTLTRGGVNQGLFTGMDTSWVRFATLALADSVRAAIDSLPAAHAAVIRATDLTSPSKMVDPLASYMRLVWRAQSGVTCATLELPAPTNVGCDAQMGDLALALASTKSRAAAALLEAAGVSVEVTATRELVAQRDTLPVTVSIYNRGTVPVVLERVALINQLASSTVRPKTVLPDSTLRQPLTYRAPAFPTFPWWLRRPLRGDMFNQSSSEMVMGEDQLLDTGVDALLQVAGVRVPVRVGPIVHRYADAARGEVRRPINTIPEISVLLQHEVEYARANVPFDRVMLVFVHSAATEPREVDVRLSLPAGLTADTAVRHVTLRPFGDANLYFRIRGRLPAGRDSIKAMATAHGETFAYGFVPLEYEHIRPQRFYRGSTVKIEAVNVTYANLRVGYIRGVGDNIMPMLEELGLPVVELDPVTLPQVNLSRFTTIVIGPRAYAASPALIANNGVLMRFVQNGGTIVTQFGTAEYGQLTVFPYPIGPLRSLDRVTDETAEVRVLDPSSPLLSTPNKIGQGDFAGWVQERSTYMPRAFDKAYRSVFSMNDKGEPPNDAAVLIAPVGKGTYIYTTFAFFRQLPAGNPGAARLFVNLLSANQRAATRPRITSGPARP